MKGIKLTVLILALSLLMMGCEALNKTDKTTYSSVTLIKNIEIEEVIRDPLVEYALDNIDFQFVSDTGYYNDYNYIASNNYSNQDMIDDIKYLGNLIVEKEFDELREVILDFPDYNNLMREVKINYIVPILMHENNYLDALRIIYKKESVEEIDNRFLFDTIYLMRYMYVNNDLETAVQIVDQLKEEYPSEDVSYVWFAVTPRQYGMLNDTGLVYPPKEDGDRNKLWKYLVDNYPEDGHIDYAYYFLGDYEKIISDYPYSTLTEKALYARANELYRLIMSVVYLEKDSLDRVDLATCKSYYETYLKAYPNSDYTFRAVSDIVSLCRSMYFTYDEDSHYYDFINAIDLMEFDGSSYNRMKTIDRILYSTRSSYIASNHLIELSDDAQAFLDDESFKESTKGLVWSGLANNAFYKGELELAEVYFANVKMQHLEKFDLFRLITLSELKPVLGKYDATSLFEKGEILRSNGEYFASVYIYNQLIELNISKEKLAKAYMLRASSSNKNRVYDEMLASYEYIVDNLAYTSFADDALAEIGTYYLLVEKDYEKSREIFRDVIERYSGTNAINNSYNWIAWSYLKEEDYENALQAYEELRDKFPTNRFGKNAVPNIKKIKELLEAGE